MHRTSYWKTTAMAAAGGSAALCLVWASVVGIFAIAGIAAVVAITLLSLVVVASSLVAVGGIVCLWRDARISAGAPDPVEGSANRISTPGILSRVGLRFLLGQAPRPGDLVQVRAFADIQATLDADGTLDGLPFMPEMASSCGRIFRVHRRVDKVNDMRHKTGLRRMEHAVTLTAVRCSGSHHGGCQAECQLLWKDAWLKRLPVRAEAAGRPDSPESTALSGDADASMREADNYRCQMTRLWEASRPMSRLDIRQDLRPLLCGNIGLGAYLLALLTRLFNVAQGWRGGIDFPAMPSRSEAADTTLQIRLADGQAVNVRQRQEVARTLKNSRNKGLWFDRDMVRFCGRPAVLRKHVDRVIHEATGKMVVMKTPCVMLDDVVATGEFLRLCPQHEYIFWREAWLQPAPGRQNARASRQSIHASHD